MTERIDTEKSAYDFIIKGKEVPPDVHEATIARQKQLNAPPSPQFSEEMLAELRALKTPHEQYIFCRNNKIPIMWAEDDAPAGKTRPGMEGGVPAKKEP